jgi:hypothetical protein
MDRYTGAELKPTEIDIEIAEPAGYSYKWTGLISLHISAIHKIPVNKTTTDLLPLPDYSTPRFLKFIITVGAGFRTILWTKSAVDLIAPYALFTFAFSICVYRLVASFPYTFN